MIHYDLLATLHSPPLDKECPISTWLRSTYLMVLYGRHLITGSPQDRVLSPHAIQQDSGMSLIKMLDDEVGHGRQLTPTTTNHPTWYAMARPGRHHREHTTQLAYLRRVLHRKPRFFVRRIWIYTSQQGMFLRSSSC